MREDPPTRADDGGPGRRGILPPTLPATGAGPTDRGPSTESAKLLDPYATIGPSESGEAVGWHAAPELFGNYELIEEIARGGMGVVYRARQLAVNRTVALKMILTGEFAGLAAIQRFRIEAESAAGLDHPHIVPIYEVGEFQGRHFFTMKLVDGGDLSTRIKALIADPRAAASLMSRVARAVHHAHRQGILHRDIKPQNILIDRDGNPQVTDFGLAKHLEAGQEHGPTITGAVIGTPGYMPPEQAAGHGRSLTTAADVYSLGAVLYETLTGRPPFQGETVTETLLQVVGREPERPRSLNPSVARDLEVICLKCLEKDPARRYGSAEALADDLEHWLRGEPIAARSVGTWGRANRWARRNPAIAGLVAAVAASLLVGTTAAVAFAVQAGHQRQVAELARQGESALKREAQRQLADLSAASGLAAAKRGEHDTAMLWFVRAAGLAVNHPETARANHVRASNWRKQLAQPVRSFAVLKFRPFQDRFRAFDLRPGGDLLLTLVEGGRCNLWDLKAGGPRMLPGGDRPITAAAWNPAGDLLALATTGGLVEVFAMPEGRSLESFEPDGPVRVLAFSHDGRLLAVGGPGRARVRDRAEHRWTGEPLAHPAEVLTLSFSRDDGRLLTSASDLKARVYRLGGESVPLFPPVHHENRSFGVSHGGPDVLAPLLADSDAVLVTVSPDGLISRWDSATGRPLGPVATRHGETLLTALAGSPDGRTVAAAWVDHLSTADLTTATGPTTIPHHHYWAEGVEFHPDGRTILTCGQDTTARIWSEADEDEGASPGVIALRHPMPVVRARFALGGRAVVTARWDGQITLWALPEEPRPAFSEPVVSFGRVALDAEGRRFAASGTSFRACQLLTTQVRSIDDGHPVGPRIDPGGIIVDAAFAPTGPTIALACSAATDPDQRGVLRFKPDGQAGNLQLWDGHAGRRLCEPIPLPSEPRGLAYAPDGSLLAVVCANGPVVLVDPLAGRVVRRLDTGVRSWPFQPNFWWSNGMARFSPDGRRLATWEQSLSAQVWDVATGRLMHHLKHDDRIHEAQFSADGRTLLTAGRDALARVWDVETGGLAMPPMRHPRIVVRARFLEGDRQILTLCDDSLLRVWDRSTGRLLRAHDAELHLPQDFAFTPRRREILVVGLNGASLLDGRTGLPLAPRLKSLGDGLFSVGIGADGTRAVASGLDRRLDLGRLDDLLKPARALGELLDVAELASSRRVHESGELVPLTVKEWDELWARRGDPTEGSP